MALLDHRQREGFANTAGSTGNPETIMVLVSFQEKGIYRSFQLLENLLGLSVIFCETLRHT